MRVNVGLRLVLLLSAICVALASPAWAWRDMNEDVLADFGQGDDEPYTEVSGPADRYVNNVCRDGLTFGLIAQAPDQIARFGIGEDPNLSYIARSAFRLDLETTTVQLTGTTDTRAFGYSGSFLVRWNQLVPEGQLIDVDGRQVAAPTEPTDAAFANLDGAWNTDIVAEPCLLSPGAPAQVKARRGLFRLVVDFTPGRAGQDLPTTGHLVEVFNRNGTRTASQEVDGNRAVFGFRVARGAQTVSVSAINDWGQGEASTANVTRR